MLRMGLVLVALAACKHDYVNTLRQPSGHVVEHTGHFFLFGLIGDAEIDAYVDCPRGVYRVVSQQTPLDTAIHLLTVWLYTPRSYFVECAA